MAEFSDLSLHGKLKYISHAIGRERGLQIVLIICSFEIILLSEWYVMLFYIIQLLGFYIWHYKRELLQPKIKYISEHNHE